MKVPVYTWRTAAPFGSFERSGGAARGAAGPCRYGVLPDVAARPAGFVVYFSNQVCR